MADLLVDQKRWDELALKIQTLGDYLRGAGSIFGELEAWRQNLVLANGDVQGEVGPTIYGQRQQPWAGDKLGTSQTTIGGFGCLMTNVASSLTDAGYPITPRELNIWLKANGGYVNTAGGTTNANLLVWSAINKLGVIGLQYYLRDCWDTAAPMDRINAAIQAKSFVIVQVDFEPDPDRDQHWVRYLGAGLMMDPWPGDIAPITRYRGKTVAECIRAVAIYTRVK
jgi:hypothetical protein